MSSSKDQGLINSIETAFMIIKSLEGEIRRTPDVDPDVKLSALEGVDQLLMDIGQLQATLLPAEKSPFLNSELLDGERATNLSGLLSEALAELSSESQDFSTDIDPSGADFSDDLKNDEGEVEETALDGSEESALKLVLKPRQSSQDLDHSDHDHEPFADNQVDEPVLDEIAGSQGQEPDEVNNLLLIEGVDEDVQSLLNAHEIYSFKDIAAFKEADVIRISELLGTPYRIARENWIEQAALLAEDIPTRYSASFSQLDRFDRLLLNSAYEAEGVPIETLVPSLAVDDVDAEIKDETGFEINHGTGEEVYHENDEAFPSNVFEQEADKITTNGVPPTLTQDILKEKQALEAELAALKEQLADRVKLSQEANHESLLSEKTEFEGDEVLEHELTDDTDNQQPHRPLDGSDLLSPRLQRAVNGDVINNVSDEGNEPFYDAHEVKTDLGDGALWHEEVSTAPDYVPPVLNEPNDDHAYPFSEQDITEHDVLDRSSDLQTPAHQGIFVSETPEDEALTVASDILSENEIYAGEDITLPRRQSEGLDDVPLPPLPPLPSEIMPVAEEEGGLSLPGDDISQPVVFPDNHMVAGDLEISEQQKLAEMAHAMDDAQSHEFEGGFEAPVSKKSVRPASQPLGAYLAEKQSGHEDVQEIEPSLRDDGDDAFVKSSHVQQEREDFLTSHPDLVSLPPAAQDDGGAIVAQTPPPIVPGKRSYGQNGKDLVAMPPRELPAPPGPQSRSGYPQKQGIFPKPVEHKMGQHQPEQLVAAQKSSGQHVANRVPQKGPDGAPPPLPPKQPQQLTGQNTGFPPPLPPQQRAFEGRVPPPQNGAGFLPPQSPQFAVQEDDEYSRQKKAKKEVSPGFKDRAQKFAESLQNSFVSKDE